LGTRKPRLYGRIKQRYPQYVAAVEALGELSRQLGPLDEKSLHLIQLGAAAAIRSEGSVHSHLRRALKAGATPDEIRHALLALTSVVGFPTVTAAMSWAEDILS
jgi:alkylhydroperoxidase/carboxymuconolactone decarboxylase family protein YurZ